MDVNQPARRPPHPRAAPSGGKASKAITLTAVGVVSLMVVAYCAARDDEGDEGSVTADCVNLDSFDAQAGTYTTVEDDRCEDDGYRGGHGAYGWYYGGLRRGALISRGTTIKPSDVRIVSRGGSVIQRGGFGGRGYGGG